MVSKNLNIKSPNSFLQHSFCTKNGLLSHPYFASISLGLDVYFLRVFDTNNNQLVWEHEWPVHQVASCLEFGVLNEKADQNQKKKRKSNHANSDFKKLVLAVGFDDSVIKLFSVKDGSLYKTLTGTHSSKISDIIIHQEGKAFSAEQDGLIVEWNLNSNLVQRKINTNMKSLTKIQLSNDSKLLLAADHSITLFSLETNQKVATLPGHATKVTQLCFSSNDKFVLSLAEEDRCISLWDCKKKDALAVLRMDKPATSVGISSDMIVFALDECGVLNLWESIDHLKKQIQITTIEPSSAISFQDTFNEPKAVLAACFDAKGKLITALSNPLKPVFEAINIVEDGSLVDTMTLTREFIGLFNESIASSSKEKKNLEKVVGATDFQLARPKTADEVEVIKTLEEQMLEMDIVKETHVKQASAGSLYSMLTQAIHSNDNDLLEKCLAVRDSKVINSTCRRLPITQVIPFLDLLLVRLQQKPSRVEGLIEWMRAMIISHAAYLMTTKGMVNKLGALYQTLDSRVSSYEKLVKLSGRLDLVMSQVNMKNSGSLDENEQEPLMVYDEDLMDQDEIIGDDVEFDNELSDEDFVNEDLDGIELDEESASDDDMEGNDIE